MDASSAKGSSQQCLLCAGEGFLRTAKQFPYTFIKCDKCKGSGRIYSSTTKESERSVVVMPIPSRGLIPRNPFYVIDWDIQQKDIPHGW